MPIKNKPAGNPAYSLAITTQGTFRFNNVTGETWILQQSTTGPYWSAVKNSFTPPTPPEN